jgi:hypothetical protein
MAVGSVKRDADEGQRYYTFFMVCRLCAVWIGTPTDQLVSCSNAAVQFFDQIQQQRNKKSLIC